MLLFFSYSRQHRNETNPIKTDSSTNADNNIFHGETTFSSFNNVKVDHTNQYYNSSPIQKQNSRKLKVLTSPHNNNSNRISKQDESVEKMLRESRLDVENENLVHDNYSTIQTDHYLSHHPQPDSDSNSAFLLIDANEHLTVGHLFSIFFISIYSFFHRQIMNPIFYIN